MTALGDAGLYVVCLHPFGEPLHVAVAVEGVRTQSPGYKIHVRRKHDYIDADCRKS
jgi:hypothetical protein